MKIYTLSTQAKAKAALVDLTETIISRDKIRASLGAWHNRLNSSISKLHTQVENIQSSESQLSDVDVATELTDFVRNHVLTQKAVAMLSQTNTLPRMALILIQ
jgi:Flagellin and related hook-associated proteins